ncbi:hypothetical protein V2A60_008176 [Cordyceps javanica]
MLGGLRRVSPSRELAKFGRRRRAARCVRLSLASLIFSCLVFFYIDCISRTTDIFESSYSTPNTRQPVQATASGHATHNLAATNSEDPSQNQEPHQFKQNLEFESAVRRMELLLPNETEVGRLLHAVKGTGSEKLREIGLRAREYKKYFQAWEQLHLVENDPESTFIRADMAPYMRRYFSTGAGKVAAIPLEQLIRTYEKYRVFMYRFEKLIAGWTAPYFSDHMTLHLNMAQGGRGIVLTGGNAQLPYLKTLIHSLRDIGCSLPIDIMYLDDNDLGLDAQVELGSLDGVSTREIGPMVDDRGWKLAGWAAKPFAILFSSFREVVFIDADSLFFRDPATLFEDEDYQRTGALFFKDRALWPESKQDWLKKVLPAPISEKVLASRYWKGESGQLQESGVVVVDKWRHFISMLVVCRMNGPDRDGNKEKGTVGVYDMVYGDKETFWIGWELVGDTDYAFHRGRVAVMGVAEEDKSKTTPESDKPGAEELKRSDDPALTAESDKKGTAAYTVCAPQLLHLGADGRPLWFNGGLVKNKFLDKKVWEFGNFREFLVEPNEVSTVRWKMLDGNRACLTGDASLKHSLDESEQVAVQTMIDHERRFL